MLDEHAREEVSGVLGALTGDVRLVVFTQKTECRWCDDVRLLAEEVAALSPRLALEVHDFQSEAELAGSLGADKIPALAVIGAADHGIHFFGLPGGYEFTSLVEAIEFPHLAQKHGVRAVPKVIPNGEHEFTGVLPEEEFVRMAPHAGGAKA